MRLFSWSLLGCLCLVTSASAEDANIGLKGKLFTAETVLTGLNNPSSVCFKPDGTLTVVDSGNGQVLLVKDGKSEPYITGFATEHWKVDAETGTKRFKLGPLSAAWVGDWLAVTNAGLGDGQETVVFFDKAGTVNDGQATNSVGPTTDDPKDKGEGNLTGLSVSQDGSMLFVAGQGSDAKSWILSVDVAGKKLAGLASADDAGIEVNSPMATMPWNKNNVLALYSGAGGKDDGLIVLWNAKNGKMMKKWTLPGLTDPMGFAVVPGTRQLVVVDNNWSLTEVKAGRLARVNLGKDSEEAKVRVIADQLSGPVSCAFGPDGKLYIAQLGKEFDKGMGEVIAVSGIKAYKKKAAQ